MNHQSLKTNGMGSSEEGGVGGGGGGGGWPPSFIHPQLQPHFLNLAAAYRGLLPQPLSFPYSPFSMSQLKMPSPSLATSVSASPAILESAAKRMKTEGSCPVCEEAEPGEEHIQSHIADQLSSVTDKVTSLGALLGSGGGGSVGGFRASGAVEKASALRERRRRRGAVLRGVEEESRSPAGRKSSELASPASQPPTPADKSAPAKYLCRLCRGEGDMLVRSVCGHVLCRGCWGEEDGRICALCPPTAEDAPPETTLIPVFL